MTSKEAIITGIVATFVGGLLLYFVTKQIDKLAVPNQFPEKAERSNPETVAVPKPIPNPATTTEHADRTNERFTRDYLPPSSSGSTTPLKRTQRFIEGEVFQACGISGLFLTTMHSGQGAASLGRKGGVFYDQDGELLSEYVMLMDKPLNLSINCSLTITDVHDVQGHSSFSILIERQNK